MYKHFWSSFNVFKPTFPNLKFTKLTNLLLFAQISLSIPLADHKNLRPYPFATPDPSDLAMPEFLFFARCVTDIRQNRNFCMLCRRIGRKGND